MTDHRSRYRWMIESSRRMGDIGGAGEMEEAVGINYAENNVVVSELPEDVFSGLLDRGLASVGDVPGLGEQTVFHPGSYEIFNESSYRYLINPYE